MSRVSRPLIFAIALAMFAALSQAVPAQATHISGCYGTRLEHLPIKAGTATVGYVDLYYSSANNGTNCVKTTSAGASVGVTKFMLAKIYRCTGAAGSNCSDSTGGFDQRDEDKGQFQSYAGPASVTGTSGRCISFVGLVTWGGYELGAGSSPRAVHCG